MLWNSGEKLCSKDIICRAGHTKNVMLRVNATQFLPNTEPATLSSWFGVSEAFFHKTNLVSDVPICYLVGGRNVCLWRRLVRVWLLEQMYTLYNLLSHNIRTWVVCVTGGQSSLFLNRYSNKDIVKESNPDRSRDWQIGKHWLLQLTLWISRLGQTFFVPSGKASN